MLSSKKFAAITLSLALSAALSACGFQLRGSYALPYKTIFVTSSGSSIVAGQIRRELTDSQTKLVSSMADADAQLTITDERRERQILSLSGTGRVQEYEFRMKITYQAVTKSGTVLIPTSEISLKRILPFKDQRIIENAQEEALMYTDMEKDAVGQILRRLIAVSRKPV